MAFDLASPFRIFEHLVADLRALRCDRRRWVGDGRLYVQARALPASRRAAYAGGVREVFESEPGVRWARYNAALGQVVVAFDPKVHATEEALDRLALRVDGLDGWLDVAHLPLAEAAFPGDAEPLARARIERATDAVAIGLGMLRKLGGKTRHAQVDLGALLTVLENVPEARGALERRFGVPRTELALSAASALSSASARGVLGPAADLVLRVLQARALDARRLAWEALEPALGHTPEAHEDAPRDPEPRPAPLPAGPIEAYGARAVAASLGGFGLGLTASRSIARASAPLFGGVPKPARLAREAFVAVLGRRLGERGAVVRRLDALGRLDRVDTLLVDARVASAARPAQTVVAAARAASLRVVWAGARPSGASPDEVVPPGDLEGVVRDLQRRGRTVMTVSGGAVAGADLALGVLGEEGAPPWSADVLCPDLADALFVVAATADALEASRHAVQVAAMEGIAGLLMSVRGLKGRYTSSVALAANAATLFAMADAVRIADAVREPERTRVEEEVAWHAMAPAEALERLVSRREGLTSREARERRVAPPEPPTPTERFAGYVLDELANPLMPVLAAGAGLSALTGAVVDAVLVASVVGFNSVLGAFQRQQTERALTAFDEREQRHMRVWREGTLDTVDAAGLVPGDVVELAAGEVVPADCRLLKSRGLEVEEASLTGESLPVLKSSSKPCEPGAPVAERHTMVFDGTAVAAGEATAVVVAVGERTQARRGGAGALERPRTGVEKRLESLTALTAPAAAVAGLGVFWAGLTRGRPAAEVIGAGVSLAVAAVPEGLPLLATIAQLAAARRLADRGALVRNPRAVEALGRVSVLCADKTGTLTEGRIRLTRVSDGSHDAPPDALDENLTSVLVAALRASPKLTGERMAHPTDQAVADGAGTLVERVRPPRWDRVAELPFAPGRGFHAVLGRSDHEPPRLVVKGAPEVLLPLCVRRRRGGEEHALEAEEQRAILDAAESLAGEGLRALVVAERDVDETRAAPGVRLREEDVADLTFRGFLGLSDPVRPTARAAVHALGEAGVGVVMITGDHPSTARAIALELALEGEVLTGPALDELDDEALAEHLARVVVFARVTPAQKVRIVRAYQRLGRMAAMTGDGANDAQAIRLADVGIALGEHATSAARDAADLVVTDGRIETIVEAILEGRALWSSVRDAVALLVGGNLGEILYTLVGGLASGRSPLNARQLLLVNMLTDTVPALAVALMPPTDERPEQLLSEGPDESLGSALTRDIVWRALLTGGATSASWLAARPLGTQKRADTIALTTLVGGQLGQTLAVAPKSPLVVGTSLASTGLLLALVETPVVSQFFGCRPLGPIALTQALAAMVGATVAGAVGPKVVARLAPGLEGPGRRVREEALEWIEVLGGSELVRDLSGRGGRA
ncbi:MAG TPA: cation-transporting P-type ATPase [Sandaracinaceae bacterium LLY-WYZ-13_1]|nr:cation-transporting P-type ATPase [Sandaracinaceae bacterium LLY-WYZ-13_1]